MNLFQQEVIEERDELAERTVELDDLVHSVRFAEMPGPQRKLLTRQLELQTELVKVLDGRIELFT